MYIGTEKVIKFNSWLASDISSCNSWDHGVHSTNVAATTYFIVPFFSPTWSPWVLDDPVWLLLHSNRSITRFTITNKQNAMIQSFSAYVWAWNSFHICLHEYCIDSHCITEENVLSDKYQNFVSFIIVQEAQEIQIQLKKAVSIALFKSEEFFLF